MGWGWGFVVVTGGGKKWPKVDEDGLNQPIFSFGYMAED